MRKTVILVWMFFCLGQSMEVMGGQSREDVKEVLCQGESRSHIQGVEADDSGIYWSFATDLFKTDWDGHILAHQSVPNHHGDCCLREGKLYVSVAWFTPEGKLPYLFVYDSRDLKLLEKIRVDAIPTGFDGIAWKDGFFYLTEGKGSPDVKTPGNWLHQMTEDFQWVKKYYIPGETIYGIQAMTYAHGNFWLGTYGKLGTIQTDPTLQTVAHHPLGVAVGIFGLPASPEGLPRFMVAEVVRKENGLQTARLRCVVFQNGKLTWQH